ncbi:MAG: hypothetical protein C4520_20075 [Candidatus Abyssobacteria bacterium SURF_5]|uniref:Glycosyltransferase RgtA/B/C/D-like domain-containing protein n=1 Tax=Abyssobacteria bacterium (strain SURF_5) TaxID=2093360 RepID=A0A3A4NF87_ABYX5|nr:MAG: hypothetical protein C4520_20075 [Candidatus Abyssubacteria bacterium SURF_5]
MRKRAHIFIILLLIILVFCLFRKTTSHNFNSDDYLVLYHASQTGYTPADALKEFTRPSWGLYYRPAITLFFDLLESRFKLEPAKYHLVSLLCYSVLCIQVYMLGFLLSKKMLVAGGAAIIFMTMTVHAQAIFWISSLNGVVENIFSLAALIVFIRWRQKPNTWLYAGSLGLFVFALFLKESAVALPIILILYDSLLGGTFTFRQAAKRSAKSTWPFVLLGMLFVILRGIIMKQANLPPSLTSFQIATSLLGLWHALLMTFSPIDWALAVNWFNKGQAAGMFFYVLAGVALVAVAGVPLLLRRYTAVFLIGWILAGAIPVVALGLVPSERHVVFSSAGGAVLIAIVFWKFADRLSRRSVAASTAILAFLVLAFSATSFSYLNERRVTWKTASDAAARLVWRTTAAYPAPAPDTTFFFLNVPDTYDGAFIFRFDNLSYALRLAYNDPSLRAVRIILPDQVTPGMLANPAYAYFRISAMGGNVYLGQSAQAVSAPEYVPLLGLPYLRPNISYISNWSEYRNSPFLVYRPGHLIPETPEHLKVILQGLYSLN